MNYLKAKPISYGRVRPYSVVEGIAIHYTGISHDSAKNEATYFHSGNQRQAGAHFFVGQDGDVWKSIPMSREAWSVGGFFTKANGAATYYNKLYNYNTVSIELCDNANRDPSPAQKKAVRELVKYIRKYCKNATKIVRHFDINGKKCPARMLGRNNKKWTEFKEYIDVWPGKKKTEPVKEEPAKKTTKKKTTKKEPAKTPGITTKTNMAIAKEVLKGKWGNGAERKKRLKEAGYDYSIIQALVNTLAK